MATDLERAAALYRDAQAKVEETFAIFTSANDARGKAHAENTDAGMAAHKAARLLGLVATGKTFDEASNLLDAEDASGGKTLREFRFSGSDS